MMTPIVHGGQLYISGILSESINAKTQALQNVPK